MHRNWSRLAILMVVSTLMLTTSSLLATPQAAQAATNNKVLILDSTVSGGAGSQEASAAIAAGYGVDVVNATTWSAMTTAQFAAYEAIVLGDATCTSLGAAAAAIANNPVWAPAVTGNVLINGTDPVFHAGQGGISLTTNGVQFAAAGASTGAYISLSCYYHGTAPMTPVPLLNGLSAVAGAGFTMMGVGCYNDAHVVATHPALSGITDATLSGWSCSVHEAFDSWPADFEVLAIARGIGAFYTASDGSVGTPYIVARGVTVISDIKLSPLTATNPVGTTHTVTATVTTSTPAPGTPVVGKVVTFTVEAGPNTGVTGTCTTDASGSCSFTYTGIGGTGTDIIRARFVDSRGLTQTSNAVEKTWVAVTATPTPTATPSPTATPPAVVGRMTGGGSVAGTDVRHGFTLRCDSSAPNNLEINWGKGQKFHLDALTTAVCSDDAAITQSPPSAAFDTFTGTGTGTLNGVAGATVEFVFVDAGEPGKNDTAKIKITDGASMVVLNVSGKIQGGNHQAH